MICVYEVFVSGFCEVSYMVLVSTIAGLIKCDRVEEDNVMSFSPVFSGGIGEGLLY